MTGLIHPTAIIEKGAQLGSNVKIGPYSIIGPKVTLADNVEIKSHVVISNKTTIGENTTIFPPDNAKAFSPSLFINSSISFSR